jgi:hypothetical protein
MPGKPSDRESEHSQRVPLNTEFAYAPSGVVVATVEWRRIGGRITPFIYAPSAEIAKRLPTPGSGMGARIKVLRKTGVLFPAKNLYRRITNCYRIDDHRRERGHSYLIWAQAHYIGKGPTFQSGLVYHFQDDPERPPYELARAVLALRNTPHALHLNSKEEVQALAAARPGVNLDGRVVVWDLAGIHRKSD